LKSPLACQVVLVGKPPDVGLLNKTINHEYPGDI